ncbi:neutral/alkaline non-lysosomal ceramidase N-terminal domain-containing protein [Acinetobacter colistiniresistens]|uniref:neutral/alkaline non-lysosomal ceramidase N-terminal domain-containing protein n=1 Tax=Acinetobacter colistiniresistens TaxID=280145 RepID=UPI00211C3BFA|nr:neutral/alkaline non-lysosomal ceramidase N-terminal domain-containing protein [Acinetobacter colistiniresistens]UUM27221.1 neutral/alkaline non-lysosomal ceramidase N-terminal domain-containing protein [Acinetobacter colistiniresistens]
MYQAGWDKQQIKVTPKGYAMFGYGQWSHRAYEQRTALYARSVSIVDPSGHRLLLCCLDLGCITHAMRSQTIAQLTQILGSQFDDNQLVLMATHTHSGPGGCGYEALYNLPTPGFVPEHLSAIVEAIVLSIQNAIGSEQDTEIFLGTQHFSEPIPIAWNRSIKAYNRNPEVQPRTDAETHLALNREMQLIGFYREQKLQSFISLFGVHATCLGNSLNAYDGDNKGYAAAFSEQALTEQGIENPVTIFAQATAGDVSPHFHGKDQLKIRNRIKGEQEYQYAQQNGRYQSELALSTLQQNIAKTLEKVEGRIDAVLSYVDLSNIEIPEAFVAGQKHAKTSQPCHGTAFFAGTPVDGLGAPKPLIMGMQFLADQFRKQKIKHPKAADFADYQQLYASQGPKQILLEAGAKKILGQPIGFPPSMLDPLIAEMNRQVKAGAIQHSPLVPSVVPLQIVRLGQLALICCPGEFTTIAGQRVVDTVKQMLAAQASIESVWLASYCNDYMGYVTTYEEYQAQAYEGGHTLFGQWTLAACQSKFQGLAEQLLLEKDKRHYDEMTRPPHIPVQELAKRTNHGNLKTAVSQGEAV